MKTLADVIAYNSAHADDALKFGQVTALQAQATDLTDPAQNAAYVTTRDNGRRAAQQAIDTVLTTNNVEAIMTPGTSIIAVGAQAGYPQLGVPAGYAATTREPMGIAFTGTAYSEAKLLAFGYAYEQAAKVRKPPSEINPSLWRCVPGNAYTVTHDGVRAEHARQRRCHRGDHRRHGAGDALTHAGDAGDLRPLRGTQSSTSLRAAAFENGDLEREFSPAGADCRYRAPLVPRLARPGSIAAAEGGQSRASRARRMAERAGFEPAMGCPIPHFQCGALGH